MRKTRPGGRTAEVRAAVFAAVEALLEEKDPTSISFPEIAERAGVSATSLYRRWGQVGALLMQVAVEQLSLQHPLPNTGSLDGDLRAWMIDVAADLAAPRRSLFFRVYLGTAFGAAEDATKPLAAVTRRLEEISALLERARVRGERAPDLFEVTDHLLAPLYVRTLFGAPPDAAVADGLVSYLLNYVALRAG